jgi:hypothetical protein
MSGGGGVCPATRHYLDSLSVSRDSGDAYGIDVVLHTKGCASVAEGQHDGVMGLEDERQRGEKGHSVGVIEASLTVCGLSSTVVGP